MIDIHAHIIPGVDDGSPDMEDSILMAQLALEGGVDTIIATPHGNLTEGWGEERIRAEAEHTRTVTEQLGFLKEELKRRGLPLRVLPGMEIFATPDAAQLLKEGILLPLAGTAACLIEFDFEDAPEECTARIREMTAAGYHPVIAHPERYDCVADDVRTAEEWIRLGAKLQVNRGSIMGSFGPDAHDAAWELLDRGLVTYIGSDAHSPYRRTPYLGDVYEVISDAYSVRRANALLEENAMRIVSRGEAITRQQET